MGEFFDPISFVLGAGTTAALGGGAYAVRQYVPDLRRSDEGAAGTGSDFLIRQSDVRYLEAMRTFFQQNHLPASRMRLTDVLIEPRLLRGRPPVLSIEQDEEGIMVERDIFRVIPFIHQFPASYASFNLETLGLIDLPTGDPHVAILGVPGSGKSTLLSVLGLIALGSIDPETDFRQEIAADFLDEEDTDEPPEVQERRRKEREKVHQEAVEQLRLIQRRNEESEEGEARETRVDLTAFLPLYVHLRHLDLDMSHYGGSMDPAEPLVRALRSYVDKVTADVSPPMIYRTLRQGGAMVLIDGYDELTWQERALYLDWLTAFKEHYAQNLIFITGPATGYDALVTMGFAPTVIRPFNLRHHNELIEKWVVSWAEIGEMPPTQELDRILIGNRNRSVLDTTMKVWATLEGDIQDTGRRGYYESYVRHQLGDIDHAVVIARDAASQWLESGLAAQQEILERIAARHFGLPSAASGLDAEIEDSKTGKEAQKAHGEIEKILQQMAEADLIIQQPNGALAFKHPVVGWYLAGETLHGPPQQHLAELGNKPNWHGALSFASAIVDVEPAVLSRVNRASDLLFEGMFSVVEWMPDAPSGLRWKGEILKRLGVVFLQPEQFPTVRRFAMAAMVAAQDDSGGVVHILRRAVRSGNAHTRLMGCIGLGALGVEEGVSDLTPMLVDEVIEVQLAAALSLAAIGTEDALRAMTEGLLSGDESLRKAIAESFATIPGEGHAILWDGIQHEDMALRRACVFGIARVPATWALVGLYRTMLEDSEWYVRSAAEIAFAHAREPHNIDPTVYPEADHYEWLAEWAASRPGQAVPEGPNGRQVLMYAMQEAPAVIRAEAARALGRLGHVPALKSLYAALTDETPQVRAAAYAALGDMADRFGRPLPSAM